jgi:cytochrome b involved in lipid metabolism
MAKSTVTIGEIKKHDREDDCWIVINDTVWDITDFIPSHPGGNESERRRRINVSKLLTCNSHHKACRI